MQIDNSSIDDECDEMGFSAPEILIASADGCYTLAENVAKTAAVLTIPLSAFYFLKAPQMEIQQNDSPDLAIHKREFNEDSKKIWMTFAVATEIMKAVYGVAIYYTVF